MYSIAVKIEGIESRRRSGVHFHDQKLTTILDENYVVDQNSVKNF